MESRAPEPNTDVPPPAASVDRWPRSVYSSGHEPDPRLSLANERTFLAWIRTALALLAVAAVVHALYDDVPEVAQRLLTGTLALTSLVCSLEAWRGWARTESAMRLDAPLPRSRASLPLVVAVAAVAFAIAVIAFTR